MILRARSRSRAMISLPLRPAMREMKGTARETDMPKSVMFAKVCLQEEVGGEENVVEVPSSGAYMSEQEWPPGEASSRIAQGTCFGKQRE